MNSYLTSKPKEAFPTFVDLGGKGNFSGQPLPPSPTTPSGSQDPSLPATETETETTEPTSGTSTTTPTGQCFPLGGCTPTTTHRPPKTTTQDPGNG